MIISKKKENFQVSAVAYEATDVLKYHIIYGIDTTEKTIMHTNYSINVVKYTKGEVKSVTEKLAPSFPFVSVFSFIPLFLLFSIFAKMWKQAFCEKSYNNAGSHPANSHTYKNDVCLCVCYRGIKEHGEWIKL